MKKLSIFKLALLLFAVIPAFHFTSAQPVLSPGELLELKRVSVHDMSPGGTELIYSVSTPRGPSEEPGSAKTEYYRMDLTTKGSSPLFEGETKGSSPQYSPDGSFIAFIYGKDDGHKQVWAIPAAGGEMVQLTRAGNDVNSFRWHPDGQGLGYLSFTPKSPRELELEKRGYGFIFYEENLKNNRLFYLRFGEGFSPAAEKQLVSETHVWDFEFSPDGRWLAFSSSEKNLIDHRYMFRKLQILDLSTGEVVRQVGNEGKLGNYVFNEGGTHLAFASALNINDHAVSQAYTYSLGDEAVTNHTPVDYRGHVEWVGWKSDNELMYYAGEGVYPKLYTLTLKKGKRSLLLDAETSGIIFGEPLFTEDLKQFVFTGNTPYDPSNIYTWDGKGDPMRITDLNPGLSEKVFGEQEVIRYEARDGMEIEGLLIKPVGYEEGRKYPLILYVHGGPEAHHSNGWLSRYATPGQVMAGKGYMAAYINYRASTGYGVEFGMEGFMDPAGKEFDDLADGIEYLVAEKGADRDRAGMAGGSYGGYAAAWFATYYTDYIKAACVFVGISNLISKRGTTDIPWEELLVHSGKPLEEQWQMNLERSPIYWAHQSKTATLIVGGADDPRVHPTQSLELYRLMKMNDHPAVRLVQYPGEGHGNRKQVGQVDVLYRQINWFDWYVKDGNPLDGPMPPLDISDQYGLDWSR